MEKVFLNWKQGLEPGKERVDKCHNIKTKLA